MLEFNYKKFSFLDLDKSIFVFEDFITDNVYESILANFPNINLSEINPNLIVNGKLGISPSHKIYEEKIIKTDILAQLHHSIFSLFFLKKIYKLFYQNILSTRKNDFNFYIRLKFLLNKFGLSKKDNKEFKYFFNYIFPEIQYSYMYNNSKITPHTDQRNKLLSLMLYFPDKNLNHNQINSLGTKFYNIPINNINNNIILDENNVVDCKYLSLPFKSKNLYGFIRSEKSWHAVEKITNYNSEFVRKSININIKLW
jgi:hypothetical protein